MGRAAIGFATGGGPEEIKLTKGRVLALPSTFETCNLVAVTDTSNVGKLIPLPCA